MSDETIMIKDLADGREVQVFYDPEPDNPRDWGPLTGIVGWHSQRRIGDHPIPKSPTEFLIELYAEQFPEMGGMSDSEQARFVKRTPYPGVLKPLCMYEHGSVAFSTDNSSYPFTDRWDAGQVGFVYVTPQKLVEREIADDVEKTEAIIKSELQAWEDFVNGNVYGVSLVEKSACDSGDTDSDVVGELRGVYIEGKDSMEAEFDELLPDLFGEDCVGTWRSVRY